MSRWTPRCVRCPAPPAYAVAVDCTAGVAAPAVVVRAMAGAAAEALENVARHARVDGARVRCG